MFSLKWTDTFVRSARKFLRQHPELRPEFELVITQLETDPAHPRLRIHPLKGQHKGKHAVSLTYSYRIILILMLNEKEITLLDIGSHDEVYR